MKKFSEYLYRKSSLPLAMGLTLGMILYASLVMSSQSTCVSSLLGEGQSLLGLKFGYDLEYANSIFSSLDDNALRCYSRLLSLWDSIFPLLYCSMYLLWLSLLYKRLNKKWSGLINLYPLIPAIMDWAENFAENSLIKSYLFDASLDVDEVQIASLITQIKWSASGINYVIIIAGIIWMLYRYNFKKKDQK
jgi:hypothetical protein